MKKKRALIIGAGPAGLTAAYELRTRTDIEPIIIEKSTHIGGISKTVSYKGNRIDIGGHRFFSKSQRVLDWWQKILPLRQSDAGTTITYQGKSTCIPAYKDNETDFHDADQVMLIRNRVSRIYFKRTFFDYPLKFNFQTAWNLGLWYSFRILLSYIWSVCFPRKDEKTLEDFFINRFGVLLYETFFKSYTEKVWGIPCNQISAEWGAQRVKGLSICKTIIHSLKQLLPFKRNDIAQKNTETSLIEQFMYPKYGPGQMWETVAHKLKETGVQILMEHEVVGINTEGDRVVSVQVTSNIDETNLIECDYIFSTMPVQDLVRACKGDAPLDVQFVAEGLIYRDFITVGLLVRSLAIKTKEGGLIPDNWIYIQEHDVHVGRLQIFNNWSPAMVADPENTVWLGLEYFCNEHDWLWNKTDQELIELGKEELHKIGIINRNDVLDGTVLRVEKTYPAYFGTYDKFDLIKNHLNRYENLFLLGRNGMHRYNNQDHSMLTAMTAVDQIIASSIDKEAVWRVNTEQEYHEQRS
jgi:protoporphyrinogen oxidase